MPTKGYVSYWRRFEQYKVSFNFGEYEVSTTVDGSCGDRGLIELKARQKLTNSGLNLNGAPCSDVVGVRTARKAG